MCEAKKSCKYLLGVILKANTNSNTDAKTCRMINLLNNFFATTLQFREFSLNMALFFRVFTKTLQNTPLLYQFAVFEKVFADEVVGKTG